MSDSNVPPVEEVAAFDSVESEIKAPKHEDVQEDLEQGAEVIRTIDSPEGEELIEKLKADD